VYEVVKLSNNLRLYILKDAKPYKLLTVEEVERENVILNCPSRRLKKRQQYSAREYGTKNNKI
tara:strand:- start:585 stop:773 length:189 start_codon:yes stop_codon:yes gene_type:complete